MLNDVFVSGLSSLVSLPFHPQWSRSFQYLHASVYQTCFWSVLLVSQISVSAIPTVKKFWKSVNIWWRYGKWQSGMFFGTQCSLNCCPTKMDEILCRSNRNTHSWDAQNWKITWIPDICALSLHVHTSSDALLFIPVDYSLIFRQPKNTWLSIAFLWFRGYGANFDKSKPKLQHSINSFTMLVKPCR